MLIKTEKIGRFSIYEEKDRLGKLKKTVYCEYSPIVHFNPRRPAERRIACVELVELGYCNNTMSGRICGFHRNTAAHLVQTKKLLGVEALIKDCRGPKTPWKYIGALREGIKALLKEHPEWTDQEIADEATKTLGESINRTAVARIRGGDQRDEPGILSKKELMELARQAEEIDAKEHEVRQLALNFAKDPELAKKADECKKEEPPQVQTETDKRLLERLQEGQRTSFAGALFNSLFLEHIGFQGVFPQMGGQTYTQADVLTALYYGLHLGLPSIEAHKLVNRQDLGLLLGKSSAPEKGTIRRSLYQMAQEKQSDHLIDYCAHQFLKQGIIDPEVFYIDGHFLPYYGLSIISKGYFTTRRMTQKGNSIYVVSDLSGRALFSITEGCEIDFRPIIQRAAEKLKDYGIERPLLVFDRGGYGVHFFSQLQLQADFITWAKYLEGSQLHDIEYLSCVQCHGRRYLVGEKTKVIKESLSTAQKEGRTECAQIEVRVVVIKEGDNGKPVAIYTCNRTRPAGDIAFFMLNRWGDSENLFKELLAKYNFDYHPGYDLHELEQQPLIDNPEVNSIKTTMKNIKEKLGRLYFTKEHLTARQKKKCAQIQEQIEELQRDLDNFSARVAQIPDKISIIELLQGKKMSVCDLEKKRIYDVIQLLTYNSREWLVELFRPCYSDPRDVKQVLDLITKRPGYVKLYGKTLIVLLDWIQNQKHFHAAVRFCHKINQMAPQLTGRLNFRLFFKISTLPQKMV